MLILTCATGAVRRFMAENPAAFDPRAFLSETIKAMKDICHDRYTAFGSAGQASKIKVRSLGDMQLAYDAGELDAKIS